MYGLVEDKENNLNMDSGEVMEHAVADTVAAMSEGMYVVTAGGFEHPNIIFK